MSQDIVSDALNNIMNAKKAGNKIVEIRKYSKLLLSILAIAKLRGYIREYSINSGILRIELGKINGCNAIKPRYLVSVKELEKYEKRYLPAKNLGIIIVSTSLGLMTHQTAEEKKIGGSLIAYMY